jgi:hypothetical protein
MVERLGQTCERRGLELEWKRKAATSLPLILLYGRLDGELGVRIRVLNRIRSICRNEFTSVPSNACSCASARGKNSILPFVTFAFPLQTPVTAYRGISDELD